MNSSQELLQCAMLVERLASALMHEYGDPPKVPGKTDREKTSNLLRLIEWKMGNGQCHFCYGSEPRTGWWTKTVGHEKDCGLAALLNSLGEKPTWIRENHSKSRYDMERRSKKMGEQMRSLDR